MMDGLQKTEPDSSQVCSLTGQESIDKPEYKKFHFTITEFFGFVFNFIFFFIFTECGQILEEQKVLEPWRYSKPRWMHP